LCAPHTQQLVEGMRVPAAAESRKIKIKGAQRNSIKLPDEGITF